MAAPAHAAVPHPTGPLSVVKAARRCPLSLSPLPLMLTCSPTLPHLLSSLGWPQRRRRARRRSAAARRAGEQIEGLHGSRLAARYLLVDGIGLRRRESAGPAVSSSSLPRAAVRGADAVAIDSPQLELPRDKPTPPTPLPRPPLPSHRRNRAGRSRIDASIPGSVRFPPPRSSTNSSPSGPPHRHRPRRRAPGELHLLLVLPALPLFPPLRRSLPASVAGHRTSSPPHIPHASPARPACPPAWPAPWPGPLGSQPGHMGRPSGRGFSVSGPARWPACTPAWPACQGFCSPFFYFYLN